MGFTIILLVARKAGLSIQDFNTYYETNHVPLVLECLRDVAPVKHTRYYLARNEAARGDAEVAPPLVPLGDASNVDYDCLTTIEYRDAEHFGAFNEAYMSSPRRAEIEEDEARFADRGKFRMIIIGDVKSTTP